MNILAQCVFVLQFNDDALQICHTCCLRCAVSQRECRCVPPVYVHNEQFDNETNWQMKQRSLKIPTKMWLRIISVSFLQDALFSVFCFHAQGTTPSFSDKLTSFAVSISNYGTIPPTQGDLIIFIVFFSSCTFQSYKELQ